MPLFEVTLVLGTTKTVRAETEDEAIQIVKHTTEWSQCDIDRVEVDKLED
ncbi:MAG: hypothetical protein JHC33_03775 [Ignisphaera sp.]|nr:hypothetical protein [Ignisphaera sp.]